MTFQKLLEIIEEMTDEEKAQEITVNAGGEHWPMSLVSVVTHSDNEDSFAVGTIIIS